MVALSSGLRMKLMNESESHAYDQFAPFYDLMMGDRSDFIGFYSSLLNPETRSSSILAAAVGRSQPPWPGFSVLSPVTPHPGLWGWMVLLGC